MTLASLLPWKRVKPADPMQEVQSDDTPADILRAQRDRAREAHSRSIQRGIDRTDERNAAWIALREIAAQETEGANATVKRMARMAREALPEYAAADREMA